MKQELNWINAVKAVCMLMVYVVHCESYYGFWMGRLNDYLHPVYVNAFFLASGYLLFRKQLTTPVIDETLPAYTASGGTGRKTLANIFFRLWIPALLFSFISFIPKKMLKGGVSGLGDFLFETFGGGTYWFISALLLCQLFIVMLLLTRQRSVWFYAVVLGIIAVAGTLALPHYGDFPEFYSFKLAPLCMSFLALGALYWCYESLFDRMRACHIAVLTVAYAAFFTLFARKAHTLISMYSFNLLGFVGSTLGCVLMVALCKRLSRIGFLTFIGRNSIVFYMLSGAIPVAVNVVFKRFIPQPGLVDLIAYIVVCVSLSASVTYVIARWMPFITDLRLWHKASDRK